MNGRTDEFFLAGVVMSSEKTVGQKVGGGLKDRRAPGPKRGGSKEITPMHCGEN